jgi:RNA polymerase sigma factor FliA
MNNLELQKVWEEFKLSNDGELRNQLIKHYYVLVKKIARKVCNKINRRVSEEELASHGFDGLYKAIDRFELERKIKFETYATLRIRGSIIDGLRSDDWVPRSVRMRQTKIEKMREKMESEKCDAVTDSEVISELDISEEDYIKNNKKFNPVIFSSIDSNVVLEKENENKKDFNKYLVSKNISSPDSKLIRKEFLGKLMGRDFKNIERKIVYYYYYENMTMREISKKVDMSESRISQIHKDVLKRLKNKINKNPEYFGENIISIIASCNDKNPVF